MVKAIAMLSGGLDSILAAKVILEQQVELEAVNFLTIFCNCTGRDRTCLASKSAAEMLGIKLKVFEVSKEYLEVVRNPRYGYGSNMNPCLDCRIFMFKKAGQYMRETQADFLITGEVLGQRPMSQRLDALHIIDRDSGLSGLIVRPLSARLLAPSLPEKQGLIDREKLLAIASRSRRPQIQLAAQLGINDYPCPAGGCLLTDPGFANRMRDLMRHRPEFSVDDIRLLKVGRHFRLGADAKAVVGRDEKENDQLTELAKKDDLYFQPAQITGPVGIGRGVFTEEELYTCCRIVARYSDNHQGNNEIEILCRRPYSPSSESIFVLPLEEALLARIRV